MSKKVEWVMRIGIDPITNSSFQQIINTRSMNVNTSFINKWQIVDLCSTVYMDYSGKERPVVGEIHRPSLSGSRKALFNWKILSKAQLTAYDCRNPDQIFLHVFTEQCDFTVERAFLSYMWKQLHLDEQFNRAESTGFTRKKSATRITCFPWWEKC